MVFTMRNAHVVDTAKIARGHRRAGDVPYSNIPVISKGGKMITVIPPARSRLPPNGASRENA